MTDKRKAKRRIVTSGAAIFCGGGTALIPCLMEDVSDAGARLKLDPAAEVPADFILVLSRNKKLNRRCQIVWREKGEIGVRFLAPHSISPEQTQPRCLDGEPLSDQRNKDKPESAN